MYSYTYTYIFTVPVSWVNYCIYDGVVDCRSFGNNCWHRFGIWCQDVASTKTKQKHYTQLCHWWHGYYIIKHITLFNWFLCCYLSINNTPVTSIHLSNFFAQIKGLNLRVSTWFHSFREDQRHEQVILGWLGTQRITFPVSTIEKNQTQNQNPNQKKPHCGHLGKVNGDRQENNQIKKKSFSSSTCAAQ